MRDPQTRLASKRAYRARHSSPSTPERRLDPAPLLVVADVPELRAATSGAMARWMKRGWLSEQQADRTAIALGMHPAEVWPDWYEISAEPSRTSVTVAASHQGAD